MTKNYFWASGPVLEFFGTLRGVLVIFINPLSSLEAINYHQRSDVSNHRGLICLWPPKFSGCQNGVSTVCPSLVGVCEATHVTN